jgi:hypothetical protein
MTKTKLPLQVPPPVFTETVSKLEATMQEYLRLGVYVYHSMRVENPDTGELEWPKHTIPLTAVKSLMRKAAAQLKRPFVFVEHYERNSRSKNYDLQHCVAVTVPKQKRCAPIIAPYLLATDVRTEVGEHNALDSGAPVTIHHGLHSNHRIIFTDQAHWERFRSALCNPRR